MTTTIQIKGTIIPNNQKDIYDFFDMESTAPKDIKLPEDNSDVLIEMNSGGGDVFAGAEIYTKLREYQGNVEVKIVGLSASAASVIAMAGDHIVISPVAQMMIHNASSWVSGNQNDMEHTAGILKGISSQIADSYAARSGRTAEEFQELMDKETWFTAKDAVENGLADEVMFEETTQAVASSGFGMLSPEAINKARMLMYSQTNSEPTATVNVDAKMLADAIHEAVQKELEPKNEKKKLFIF